MIRTVVEGIATSAVVNVVARAWMRHEGIAAHRLLTACSLLTASILTHGRYPQRS